MKEEIDNILEGFHLNEYDLLEVRKKLLVLFSVSQKRELLKAFLQYVNCSDTDSKVSFDLLDEYLNSL